MYARSQFEPTKIVTYFPKNDAKLNPVEYLGIITPAGWLIEGDDPLEIFISTLGSNPPEFLKIMTLSTDHNNLIRKFKNRVQQTPETYQTGYEIHIIECNESISLLFTSKQNPVQILTQCLQKLIKNGYDIYYGYHKPDLATYVNPPLSEIDSYLFSDTTRQGKKEKDQEKAVIWRGLRVGN